MDSKTKGTCSNGSIGSIGKGSSSVQADARNWSHWRKAPRTRLRSYRL
jgi:hypothetical protein